MTKRKKRKSKSPQPMSMPVLPAGSPPVRIPPPGMRRPVDIREARSTSPIVLQSMKRGETIFQLTDERPIRLHIRQHQSPGDILMLSAAVRDLHEQYPALFLTDIDTSAGALFESSKYHTPLDRSAPGLFVIQAEYPLVHQCNEGPWHFVQAFHKDLETKLGLPISPTKMWGHVELSDEEKGWYSQIHEIIGVDLPYWIIDAGCKSDYTCKLWEVQRYQEVVNRLPELLFVQVGVTEKKIEHENGRVEYKDKGHIHIPLQGDNVINLLDKTDMRQFVRLMYHACGVITPVSFPMHLAAAVEMKDVYKRKTRPCIVIAGGREPSQWEAYGNHQFLHTCGQLDCCDNGGCWKSRIIPLNDGEKDKDESLCLNPVEAASGQIIPKCMDMITVDEVVMHVRRYMEQWNYYREWNEDDKEESTAGPGDGDPDPGSGDGDVEEGPGG